ncbi:MAG: hypothetical protein ACE5KA_00065 [Nitrososphaerales archaeon]
MITIDCSDIENIIVEVAAYLADNVEVVPAIKTRSIVLDPLVEKDVRAKDVSMHLENFLAEKGLARDFIIKVRDEKIMVVAISETKIEAVRNDSGLLVCPFCGLVTPHEEEMNVHMRADLAGGICF